MYVVTDGVDIIEMPTRGEATEYCMENKEFKEVEIYED